MNNTTAALEAALNQAGVDDRQYKTVYDAMAPLLDPPHEHGVGEVKEARAACEAARRESEPPPGIDEKIWVEALDGAWPEPEPKIALTFMDGEDERYFVLRERKASESTAATAVQAKAPNFTALLSRVLKNDEAREAYEEASVASSRATQGRRERPAIELGGRVLVLHDDGLWHDTHGDEWTAEEMATWAEKGEQMVTLSEAAEGFGMEELREAWRLYATGERISPRLLHNDVTAFLARVDERIYGAKR